MRRIRQKGTEAELKLRSALHARGFRFRVQVAPLAGVRRRADLVFPRIKLAIFVDGCFWHSCPTHRTQPKENAQWWATKLAENVRRDRDTDRLLKDAGWAVLRFWEHEDPDEAAARAAPIIKELYQALSSSR
jgi:DNA mismatch endonuclease (patch repair protein)